MSVLILACGGGLLAILIPCCSLPVLPFVFARLGQPFRSSVLPMLVGMAASFAAVGSLADPLSQPLVRVGTGSERLHTFAIEFLDPGMQAYAFTFG